MFGFKRKRKLQRATIEQPTQPTAEVTPIEANVRDTILTSNVCGGTNPDLPPQTDFREAPETPAPAETKPRSINRDCRIKIRLSDAELADVRRKAADAGTDCSKYVRTMLNAAEIVPTPQPDYDVVGAPLRKAGQHLDDILARANTMGFLDVPELQKAISECREGCLLIRHCYGMEDTKCGTDRMN